MSEFSNLQKSSSLLRWTFWQNVLFLVTTQFIIFLFFVYQTNFYLLMFYAAQSLVFCVVIYKSLFAANKEATEPRVPFGKVEVITSKILRSPPWLGWPLWNICVTNDHGYVPLVVNTSRSFPHSRLITGFVTRLTRRVSLVEQELLTLPEHLSSPPVLVGFVLLDL